MNKHEIGEPLLLNKLASLTAIRDVELFEISLLKTLVELLKINQISMYKLNNPNSVTCWFATYSRNLNQDVDKQHFSELREISSSEIAIPEEIILAKNWIESSSKPYVFKRSQSYSVVYPIFSMNVITNLLAFDVSHSLTEEETLVITSLLMITKNYQSLLDENQKDKLTGLLNRQTFDESINKILSIARDSEACSHEQWEEVEKRRAHTEQEKHFLAIFDIDFFKKINDRFGHIIGDEVLLQLSYMMKQIFRTEDLLFRVGGEEFVVILCSCNTKEDARSVFERFRIQVSEHRFPKINKVTISIGVTAISSADILISSGILGRADKAMYHAKNNGRNQLHFYEDLLQAGYIGSKEEEGTIDFF